MDLVDTLDSFAITVEDGAAIRSDKAKERNS